MKIKSYEFGRIEIDGNVYTRDVIIYGNRINSSWWRKEGHYLQVEDIEEILNAYSLESKRPIMVVISW